MTSKKSLAPAPHTPLPWRIEPEHADENGNFIEATIWHDGDGTDANPQRHIATIRCGLKETDANASLLLFAPNLLEATKKCAQGLRNLCEFGLLHGNYAKEALAIAAEYDSLIRKAEGTEASHAG